MTGHGTGAGGDALVAGAVPLAVVTRSGRTESVHHGVAVVVDATGRVVHAAGHADVAVYARSAMKPVQAEAMVRAGLALEPGLLALVTASHEGTPEHLAGVRRILAGAGLDETALATTPALPLGAAAAEAYLRAGGQRSALAMNCSGKHAGMLATCVRRGWPTHGYLERTHPLQRHVDDVVAELVGPIVHVGVDGCGTPAHVVALADLARGVGRIAAADGPVARAMTAHPEMVGGPTRPVTHVARAVPGLLVKDGAEGLIVAAVPDGGAVAVKIADGAARAAAPVAVALLGHLGVPAGQRAAATAALAELQPVLGHGRPVGVVRALVGDG